MNNIFFNGLLPSINVPNWSVTDARAMKRCRSAKISLKTLSRSPIRVDFPAVWLLLSFNKRSFEKLSLFSLKTVNKHLQLKLHITYKCKLLTYNQLIPDDLTFQVTCVGQLSQYLRSFWRYGSAESLDEREVRTIIIQSFQVTKLNITPIFCCLC